jgi:hypothetical protein
VSKVGRERSNGRGREKEKGGVEIRRGKRRSEKEGSSDSEDTCFLPSLYIESGFVGPKKNYTKKWVLGLPAKNK